MRTTKFTLAFLFMLLALGFVALSAHAESWTRAVVADDVAITVNIVSIEELNHKRGGLVVMGQTRAAAHGYAVLYRAKSGELKCNVYVTRAPTAETLEHEARHCHGWVHQ